MDCIFEVAITSPLLLIFLQQVSCFIRNQGQPIFTLTFNILNIGIGLNIKQIIAIFYYELKFRYRLILALDRYWRERFAGGDEWYEYKD